MEDVSIWLDLPHTMVVDFRESFEQTFKADTSSNNSDSIDLKHCLEIKTDKNRLWLSFATGAVLDMSHEF